MRPCFAVNYSAQAAGLVAVGALSIDRFKCPPWRDLVAKAATLLFLDQHLKPENKAKLRDILEYHVAVGTYRADSYDALVDAPVEMGAFWSGSFKACGVPHRFVVAGALPATQRSHHSLYR